MNTALVSRQLDALSRAGLGAPLMVLLVIGMMVLPLHPLMLDALFTFNISLSMVVILAVIYVLRPLDLGVFPTVLLAATLLRLALNVASTRVVLINGHTGPDAAGQVIKAFGEFVVGGNYAVGIVVFAILVIINFVVITKGAGRVSEVTARFTLDSMPGKQMAIDADLNAGVLTQEEASERRDEIRAEADFYGAMDGASKFVRGDAVAGILILFINLLGGLAIGTLQHDMAMGEAARTYTLLTIGDGLVAQVPALLLSTAVAIIVTRMSRREHMGRQISEQLLGQPRVLGVAGGVLALLGMIPGMPNIAFLALAAVCGGGAWLISRRKAARARDDQEPAAAPQPAESAELTWDDVSEADPIGLEVGYRLISLVDKKRGGELTARIKGVRKKLSEEFGFLLSPVHIRDNLDLSPATYAISLLGARVAEAEIQPDRWLAIDPGSAGNEVEGVPTTDPAFGLPARWIDPAKKEYAQTLGYTVVDPATVIATHLSKIIGDYGHELLGHEEAQQLLDRLARSVPKLVEDLVPKIIPMSVLVRVLQELLREGIPVHNMRRICETLAEQGPHTKDPAALVAAVRVALGRSIVQNIAGNRDELPVITLDPGLERILQDSLQGGEGAGGIEPGLAESVHMKLAETVERQEIAGEPAVLLVSPTLRSWLSRFLRQGIPALKVLAYNEVPENRKLRMVGAVGT